MYFSSGEVQILDYQTQQLRLFPQMARAIVFLFAAYEVKDLYMRMTSQLQEGNLELLPELHGLSSGLKSVVSWEVAQGIEQCRLACGGHGYSQASAFPEIYSYAVGGCTYEGENIVMLLQVARYLKYTCTKQLTMTTQNFRGLMKIVASIRAGTAKLAQLTSYIAEKPSSNRSHFTCVDNVSASDFISDFEHTARAQIFYAYDLLKHNESRFNTPEEAWNKTGIELCKASRLHVKAYLVRNYFNYVSRCNDPEIRPILDQIGKLYALDNIAGAGVWFTRNGYYSDDQMATVRQGIYSMLEALRPNAVAIVDSFDFSDRELQSVLGRRDGNVYENLLKWAQQSPLTRSEISTAYTKHLKPMMIEGRSKL